MRNSTRTEGLSRREFAAACSAAAAAVSTAGTAQAAEALAISESTVPVPGAQGLASSFFVHPAEGAHSAVVLWPDLGGLRENGMAIARELAASGLSVLVVDPEYRAGQVDSLGEALRLRADLTPQQINRDFKAFTAWLDSQPAVKSAADGYVLANKAAQPSLASARKAGGSYLVATPKGRSALDARQQAALDRALAAMARLASVEVHPVLAA